MTVKEMRQADLERLNDLLELLSDDPAVVLVRLTVIDELNIRAAQKTEGTTYVYA